MLQQVIHLLETQKGRLDEDDSGIADSAGLFPITSMAPDRNKNTSQKRNAELINSLLGLPRIMKVVG